MSKTVLISIKPEWCGLIASGNKTIEIRKTRPKLETPFKCYIYCTLPKSSGDIYLVGGENPVQGNGKVIGEFVCDEIDWIGQDSLVVKEDMEKALKGSCLTKKDIYEYLNLPKNKDDDRYRQCYAWHISNLVIYDKSRELSEFYSKCDEDCPNCEYYGYVRVNAEEFDMECASGFYAHKPLKRPPQSWCYVTEVT